MTGVVFLDKPTGITSFLAVSRVRRLLGTKKAGHTGTLDPMATGVLPVMIGGATRFIDFLPEKGKAYEAVIRLGITTDTLDIQGKLLTEHEVNVGKEDFLQAMSAFRGTILQTPPMYSALKVDGERLYSLARRGVEIERAQREITISSFEMLSCDESKNEYRVSVSCSAGTYIRSLAADLGEALGCGAVLTELRRTSANGVKIENCISLQELESLGEAAVRHVEEMLGYPDVTVTAAQAKRFSNGGALDLKRLNAAGKTGIVRVFSPEAVFIGLGEIPQEGCELLVRRVMA